MDTKIIVSGITALFMANYIKDLDIPSVIKTYLIPIFVLYFVYTTLTFALPTFDKSTKSYIDYSENIVYDTINDMLYFKIFPVFCIILLLLTILIIKTSKKS